MFWHVGITYLSKFICWKLYFLALAEILADKQVDIYNSQLLSVIMKIQMYLNN